MNAGPAIRIGLLLAVLCAAGRADVALAQPPGEAAPVAEDAAEEAGPSPVAFDPRRLIRDAGWIGWVIVFLSIAMLALLVEHLLSIRRGALVPGGLADDVHRHLAAGEINEARQRATDSNSFLGYVLDSGLAEVGLGYDAVEKAMEDSAVAQSSRLYRKIEYLSIIGTIAPMLGLLGTVWGMIQAFQEFELTANPQVSELAPGIYRALVTTLLGLSVAVPALAGYGVFRNRIEGLADEATQLAEHVFLDFRRAEQKRRVGKRAAGRASDSGRPRESAS